MEPVNQADLDWTTENRADTTFKRKHLSSETDDRHLGCSLYELPPGGRSWPYHYHTRNAEAIYVLEGRATLRHPNGETPLEAGDYVPFPPSDDGGHRLRNETDEPLVYLAVSTMDEPDVTVYPDTETFGVYVGSPPGGRDHRPLHGYYRIDDDVDYWAPEE